MFLSRPKMADVQDAILCFLVVFWGAESQLCIQSEAAGGSHICRHLCVYLRLRSSSQPTQGQPTGMSSVFGKNGKGFLAQSRAAFFFFSFFNHMPESQEASELFVGLSHVSALTFQSTLNIKLFVYYLFKRNTFLKDIYLCNKPARLISGHVNICKTTKGFSIVIK